MGDEIPSGSLIHDTQLLLNTSIHWKGSYLEPISGSLQKTKRGRLLLVENSAKGMVKAQRAYLERIRNRMREPIEGRSPWEWETLVPLMMMESSVQGGSHFLSSCSHRISVIV
jgi:hypothetical protein